MFKKILDVIFGFKMLGLYNPILWIFAGCASPLLGMALGNESLSKPVNPLAIVLWAGAVISIVYNLMETKES